MKSNFNFEEAFAEQKDVHTAYASWMFEVSEEDVTKEQRQTAKQSLYRTLYSNHKIYQKLLSKQ